MALLKAILAALLDVWWSGFFEENPNLMKKSYVPRPRPCSRDELLIANKPPGRSGPKGVA